MNKKLLLDVQNVIRSLANNVGMTLEEVDENYNDIYKRLEDESNNGAYVVKLSNDKYAAIHQISTNEVEVYCVERDDADKFDIERATRLMDGINLGEDKYGFLYYSKFNAIEMIEEI